MYYDDEPTAVSDDGAEVPSDVTVEISVEASSETTDEIPLNTISDLPLVSLGAEAILPTMVLPLRVDGFRSMRAIEQAVKEGRKVALVAHRGETPGTDDDDEDSSTGEEEPLPLDKLCSVGIIAMVEQVISLNDGAQRVVIRGVCRARVLEVTQTDPFARARVEEIVDPKVDTPEAAQLVKTVRAQLENYVQLLPGVPKEVLAFVRGIDEPGRLADMTAYSPEYTFEQRQEILEIIDPMERLRKVYDILQSQLEILELRQKIQQEVHAGVDKQQREYFLREQIKVIRKELGEADPEGSLIEELREKVEKAGMSAQAKEKALREVSRLSQQGPNSPEASVIRTYLEWLTELPWSKSTDDHLDLMEAARVLDEDHYGLPKVKERILEYIAVRKLAMEKMKSPIICFVGPPGVGKTSLGRSIARALGRNFVRMSLGGIRDEAEIRGHRRTYVGALPGRILQGIRNAKSNNPVFMLDEIDKVGADFRGDPSAALLEVLDPEQNNAFQDHYLEVTFDLSKVIFVTTANLLDPIVHALRDRMEIIHIPGYTEEEKVAIARGFLVPKQLEAHGLIADHMTVDDSALYGLVQEYTREAGVRSLERELASIARKTARKVAGGDIEHIVVKREDLPGYLGPQRFTYGLAEAKDEIGVANGVAWTEVGGELLNVEVIVMEGKGQLSLTGHLGKVMQESAQAAVSYARSRAASLGLKASYFDEHNIHVHVPAGATPKDGPSAGITLATALVSALTQRPVRKDVAMTGEITLRGKVLPIGGLKEKSMAAQRAGITHFILPKGNEKDIVELSDKVRASLTFHPVEHIDEVLALAIIDAPTLAEGSGNGHAHVEVTDVVESATTLQAGPEDSDTGR